MLQGEKQNKGGVSGYMLSFGMLFARRETTVIENS